VTGETTGTAGDGDVLTYAVIVVGNCRGTIRGSLRVEGTAGKVAGGAGLGVAVLGGVVLIGTGLLTVVVAEPAAFALVQLGIDLRGVVNATVDALAEGGEVYTNEGITTSPVVTGDAVGTTSTLQN
jgi:predicted metalloprotease